jgi:hypothetical protein
VRNPAAKLRELYRTRRQARVADGNDIEQVTYLIFLKMASERGIDLPAQTGWQYLRDQTGVELNETYARALRRLRRQSGMLGDLFRGAESEFTDPLVLKKLIDLIDDTEWMSLNTDARGDVLATLIEKAFAGAPKGSPTPALPHRRLRRARHSLVTDATSSEAVYAAPRQGCPQGRGAAPARRRLVAWLGLSAWCLASAVLVFLFSGASITVVVVVPFVLLAPGIAVVLLLRLPGVALGGTLVLLTAVATSVLVPSILLYAGAWSPRTAFAMVAGATLALTGLGAYDDTFRGRRLPRSTAVDAREASEIEASDSA